MSDTPNPEIRTEDQPETVQTPQPTSEPTGEVEEKDEAPVEVPETPSETHEEIDYKAKFAESTREAQVLTAKLRAYEENPRRELTKEPAESELRAAFPDWEQMQPWEREAAKRSLNAERIASTLAEERATEREAQRWSTDLEMAIAKNPSLQGKEAAFKEYAKKPTHRGAPMETLISAFLYEAGKSPAPKSKPSAPALEPGNGGPRGPIDSKKTYSADEIMTLQTSDPRKYREMLLNGDFED